MLERETVTKHRLHLVASLAAVVGLSDLKPLRVRLQDFLPDKLPPRTAYEIVLQSYLFFGYAQAIEACKVFADVLREKSLPLIVSQVDSVTSEVIRKRGEKLCRRIYAPNFERLIGNMREVSPELAEWMVVEGYGKVLSRPNAGTVEREVASIVYLSISGHPVQLYSHVRAPAISGSRDWN